MSGNNTNKGLQPPKVSSDRKQEDQVDALCNQLRSFGNADGRGRMSKEELEELKQKQETKAAGGGQSGPNPTFSFNVKEA